jgi:hypothetical protein
MEDTSNNYIKMTKNELVILCKEKGIRGYAANGITKDKIILLIKEYDLMKKPIKDDYNNMKYDTLLALCRERKIRSFKNAE